VLKLSVSVAIVLNLIRNSGTGVIGVFSHTCATHFHQKFKAKYRLPYTLLSDEGNTLRKEFGVPPDFFGALAGRQTYVTDRQGVVQLIYNNQFQPEKHIQETLKFLQG
jgi:peroxiredoxin Q/BCP